MNKIKKRESNFTTVSNLFLRDNRISFKAKGLFCYMFSMDESWNFTIQSIAKQQKDGEDSVRTAINELKEYGFIEYEKHNDGSGTYYLNDEPKSENPNLENPILGKSERIKKEKLVKNKNCNNTPLPPFINPDVWAEWVQHRKEIKKPLTPSTIKKQIAQLEKFNRLGMDTTEVINASISAGYVGLFPLRTGKKYQSHQSKVATTMSAYEKLCAEREGKQNVIEGEIV